MRQHFIGLGSFAFLLGFAAFGAGCDPHLVIGGLGAGGGGGAPPASSSGSGANTGNGGQPGDCPSTHGPAMVRIPAPAGSASYCIDTTEVTQAQYQEFVASGAHPSPLPDRCAYKTTFAPSQESADPDPNGGGPDACIPSHPHFDPIGTPGLPVVCVDWCDAAAFCAWSGKRLCGRIGGGPSDETDMESASTGEWYRACSSAGAEHFPYGASFVAGACSDGADLVSVGSASGCHGVGTPYDQIFDMSGNVAEWENACWTGPIPPDDPGGPDECIIRGGGAGDFHNDAIEQERFACAPHDGGYEMDAFMFQRPRTGFRCCAD